MSNSVLNKKKDCLPKVLLTQICSMLPGCFVLHKFAVVNKKFRAAAQYLGPWSKDRVIYIKDVNRDRDLGYTDGFKINSYMKDVELYTSDMPIPDLARILHMLFPFTDEIGLVNDRWRNSYHQQNTSKFIQTVDALQFLYNSQMLSTSYGEAKEEITASSLKFTTKKFTVAVKDVDEWKTHDLGRLCLKLTTL